MRAIPIFYRRKNNYLKYSNKKNYLIRVIAAITDNVHSSWL